MGKKILPLVLVSSLILILTILQVSAIANYTGSAAYITNNLKNIKPEITGVFNQLGLNVTPILDSNVPATNLSKYNLVFIDDAYLPKTKLIAVTDYPSVIMNKYYGPQWGLTDADGISQLAASGGSGFTDGLEVRVDDLPPVEVYNRATFPSGIAIPYFFLDDENKPATLETFAKTYRGSINNDYDNGTVIATIQKGTLLVNHRISKDKICFYGIAKTPYWTNAARDLFLDCVGGVLIECKNNSECADYDASNIDVCLYPGTYNSTCVHYLPNCSSVNDPKCGTIKSTLSCSANYSVNTTITPSCLFPNTLNSTCINTTTTNSTLCAYGCYGAGICANDNVPPIVTLILPPNKSNTTNPIVNFTYNVTDNSSISRCGLNINGLEVTAQSAPISLYFTRTLTLGNHTWSVSCKDAYNNTGVSETRVITILPIPECVINSDCGLPSSSLSCSGNNSVNTTITPTCSAGTCTNITTTNSTPCAYGCNSSLGTCNPFVAQCSNHLDDDIDLLIDIADPGCHTDGNASNPLTYNASDNNESNPPIICNINSDCGTNHFVGELFCNGPTGNDVFAHFIQFQCNNPGTISSYCSNSTITVLNKTCIYGCFNGSCNLENNPPDITLINPLNNTSTTNPNINFVYNVTDYPDNSSITYCDLMIDGVNVSRDNTIFDVTNAFSRTLSLGEHLWAVRCADSYNNLGISETRVIKVYENIPPVVTLILPLNNSNTTNPIVNFTYNVTDNSSISRCALNLDGLEVMAQSSPISLYFTRALVLGVHTWSVSCNDIYNNTGTSETRTVRITTVPECVINSDCGLPSSSLSCSGNNSVNTTITPTCSSGTCTNVTTTNSTLCAYGCNSSTGSCKSLVPQCSDLVDNDLDLLVDIADPGCHTDGNASNPLTYNASDNNESNIVVQCVINSDCGLPSSSLSCSGNNSVNTTITPTCSAGTCTNITTTNSTPCAYDCNSSLGTCNTLIKCYTNADCGINGFFGDNYCVGKNVTRDYRNFLCTFPGTAQSYCSFLAIPQLIQECSESCVNGSCTNPIDPCNAPGAIAYNISSNPMWVIGWGCWKRGGYVNGKLASQASVDGRYFWINSSGKYDIYETAQRGNLDQCQANEKFYLYLNGKTSLMSNDDADACAESLRQEYLGTFDMLAGNNLVYMYHGYTCNPSSNAAESVEMTKICFVPK